MKVDELFEGAFADWARENKQRKERERDLARQHQNERQRARARYHSTEQKAHRQEEKKQRGEALDRLILNKVEHAIQTTFPDGDPIDFIGPFLERNNLTMADVNRVWKKHTGVTFEKHQIQMWDDATGDAVHHAKAQLAKGHEPDESPFYDYNRKDKTITRAPNPWRPE